MATFTIEIDREALPDCTDDQLEEWVKYCIGERGGIEQTNPLCTWDITHARLRDWSDR